MENVDELNKKEKKSEYLKQYYKNNKANLSIKAKERYYNNREKIIEKTKKYYNEHKEGIRIIKKLYAKNHKEKLTSYRKEYYINNKDDICKRVTDHRNNNQEIIKIRKRQFNKDKPGNNTHRSQKYRNKKQGLEATLTISQWDLILKEFNYECAYCETTEKYLIKQHAERLNKEHFIPLSRGGEFTGNNIIPACKRCNSSKGNKDFFKWYPKQKSYSKTKENKILKYLHYKNKSMQQLSMCLQ